jgi:hypothetical protein
LRLFQAGQAMHDFLRIKIYHADCIVPQFGDEQPVVRQVDRQMINAAADIAQNYFMFELQRIRHRLCDDSARKTQMHKSDSDREDYYQSMHDNTRYEPGWALRPGCAPYDFASCLNRRSVLLQRIAVMNVST